MHALEWHHMQTLSIEDILALAADETRCDVFNLSVVRWLGDRIGKRGGASTPSTTTDSSKAITTAILNSRI